MLLAQEKPVKFSGEVKAGQEFRKPIGHGLLFLLKADDDGWIIEVYEPVTETRHEHRPNQDGRQPACAVRQQHLPHAAADGS